MLEWGREFEDGWVVHTGRNMNLQFYRFFFILIIQGHLKAFNQFLFYSFLCFCESGEAQVFLYLLKIGSLMQGQCPEQLFRQSSSLSTHLCRGRVLPWFVYFPGCPHSPRGHSFRQQVDRRHASCRAYYQGKLRGAFRSIFNSKQKSSG